MFSMVVSYCCDNLDAQNLSEAGHGAESQHRSVKCHSMYKDMVVSRGTSSRVV